ncbi:MAG: hypothetical protein HYW90_01565 [Candidatus Sungbacteria bacterium]|nr:hypothetical protein [Candidatus Sungbacteria bacterium]
MDKVEPEKPDQYPALVEVSTRTVHVFDETIYDELCATAAEWEQLLEKELNLHISDAYVTIAKF